MHFVNNFKFNKLTDYYNNRQKQLITLQYIIISENSDISFHLI